MMTPVAKKTGVKGQYAHTACNARLRKYISNSQRPLASWGRGFRSTIDFDHLLNIEWRAARCARAPPLSANRGFPGPISRAASKGGPSSHLRGDLTGSCRIRPRGRGRSSQSLKRLRGVLSVSAVAAFQPRLRPRRPRVWRGRLAIRTGMGRTYPRMGRVTSVDAIEQGGVHFEAHRPAQHFNLQDQPVRLHPLFD